jgi:hypothetical protein
MKKWLLSLAFFLAFLVRLLLIQLFEPATDVFYYDKEAVELLLNGKSPYEHNFKNIPVSLKTEGAENVYAYPPIIPFFLLVFYFLGDVRYAGIFADLMISLCIYFITKRLKTAWKFSYMLYLFFPVSIATTSIFANNMMISSLFLILSVLLFIYDRQGLGSLSYGLSLASSQLVTFTFPFYIAYLWFIRKVRLVLISLGTAFLTFLPYLLNNFKELVWDMLLFQLQRRTYPTVDLSYGVLKVNLGLNGFFYTIYGFNIPFEIRVATVLAALIPLLIVSKGVQKTFLNAGIFTIIAVMILPKNTFLNYFLIPTPLLFSLISTQKFLTNK